MISMTTLKLNVDIIPGTSAPSVSVSQGDHESRTLLVTLLQDNRTDFTIPAGATVEIRGTKPSGKGFNYGCTFSGNVVTVNIKDQMTAEPGKVPCEISIESNGRTLSSANFDMYVERAALQPGTVASSDTFDSLVRKVVVNVEGNLFTNALKGQASGAPLQINDVSPLAHNPDVRVHGKNLFNYARMDFANRAGALTDNGNNSVTVKTPEGSSAVSTKATLRQLAPTLKVGKTYILSFVSDGTDKFIYLSITQRGWNNKGVLSVTEGDLDSTVFLYASGVSTTATISNIQIEEGTTSTPYEPWVDPTGFKVTDGKGNTYTPNSDGYVEGVTSTSPTMTLSLDKEGAVIDCEYNRDLTAVISKLEAALLNN